MSKYDLQTLLALLIIQEIPDDLYARVCAYFETDARGCTYEQIKAYMRHALTNYDALRKSNDLTDDDYLRFKAEVIRRTELAYSAWREGSDKSR